MCWTSWWPTCLLIDFLSFITCKLTLVSDWLVSLMTWQTAWMEEKEKKQKKQTVEVMWVQATSLWWDSVGKLMMSIENVHFKMTMKIWITYLAPALFWGILMHGTCKEISREAFCCLFIVQNLEKIKQKRPHTTFYKEAQCRLKTFLNYDFKWEDI